MSNKFSQTLTIPLLVSTLVVRMVTARYSLSLSLVEDDWNTIIKECSSLAANWEHLSGFLGLTISLIDVIKGTPPFTVVGCWNEALKHWIKQNYNTGRYGVPSWRTLLEGVARVDMLLFKKLAAEHQGTLYDNTLYDRMRLAAMYKCEYIVCVMVILYTVHNCSAPSCCCLCFKWS